MHVRVYLCLAGEGTHRLVHAHEGSTGNLVRVMVVCESVLSALSSSARLWEQELPIRLFANERDIVHVY